MPNYKIIEHPHQPQMALVNETGKAFATVRIFLTPNGYRVNERYLSESGSLISEFDNPFNNSTLEDALQSAHRFLARIHHDRAFSVKGHYLYGPLQMLPQFEKTVFFE